MLGLSEFLHREFVMKALFQLFDICLIAFYNKHVVDIYDQIDPRLVAECTCMGRSRTGVVKIRHYVRIVRRNHRGSGPEGSKAQTCKTSKI